MPIHRGFPGGSEVKASASNAGDLGGEDPLEKEMVTHSSILAWKIPWTEKPGRSLVGYSPRGHKESDTTERLHLHLHILGEGDAVLQFYAKF